MSQDLEQSTERLGENINSNMVKYIFERFPVAISDAEKKAMGTVTHWGSPVDRSNRPRGGYPYSTYKAICRRNGIYANRQGAYDWNEQLLAPMISKITSGWNYMFATKISSLLSAFAQELSNLLKKFHESIDALVTKARIEPIEMTMLRDQLSSYQDLCKGFSKFVGEQANEQQKEINRKFICAIQSSMTRAYEESSKKIGMLSP